MFIYPYKMGSESVKSLKYGLNAKVIKLENSQFKGSGKYVINWGNSEMIPELLKAVVLNKPEAVKKASNKLAFFNAVVDDVTIPEYTTDKDKAEAWLMEGSGVVVREVLTGHSGKGVVFINSLDDWGDYDHSKAKLYVKYIPKKDEYRVHVMNGEVIDVQRKAARKDFMGYINWKVRNYSNGFVFVREGVEPNDLVLEESIKAVEAIGLDFGAVDVVWNNYRGKAYVIEVNTAPGLEGTTLKNYIESLTEWANGVKGGKKSKKNPAEEWGKFNFIMNDLLVVEEEHEEEEF